jgi:hypothetical protein
VETVLPSRFKFTHVVRFHVWRNAFQDAETKISRAAAKVNTVAARRRMTLPPAKDVVSSVGGTDVTFSVRVIEDVVDAAPVV